MKLLLIAYNEALEGQVQELLQQHRQTEYTQWTRVLGRGRGSGPHLMSHVWPKANNVLLVGVEDALATALLADIRFLRRTLGREGLKAFCWSVDEVT